MYAPHDGVVTVTDDGAKGYGLWLCIEDQKRRSILAHLSQSMAQSGQTVYQGDPIAKSGRSGMAEGPHLHWTYKVMKNGVVQNKDNGYNGAVDVTEFTRLWLDQDLHFDADYTDDAKPYLAMTFTEKQYLKNPARHT